MYVPKKTRPLSELEKNLIILMKVKRFLRQKIAESEEHYPKSEKDKVTIEVCNEIIKQLDLIPLESKLRRRF